MRSFLVALSLCLALPSGAFAEVIRVKAAQAVDRTMDALEAAVTGAGATVFARIDHAAGAQSAGMDLGASQVLVFGNPKLGTPAMQDDPLAGLYLPLKVLVYADPDGQVWLAYDDPAQVFGDLDIPADAAYLGAMAGGLRKLTGAAAGG